MGSRAVVVVCRDEEAARRRFGIAGEGFGVCYTRTGRRFFDNQETEVAFLQHVRGALDATGFWKTFETEWVCLDCELMPWSAKAQELLRQQYAPVGSAAKASAPAAVTVLEQAAARAVDVAALLARARARVVMTAQYVEAYRRYCWPVHSVADLKLAPFHILATEGKVHMDKDHVWHMETLANSFRADETLLFSTPYKVVDITDQASQEDGCRWWQELTGRGGEGMVVKLYDFIAKSPRGVLQPAINCRGREYLRIIYGLEYTAKESLERLRNRGLSAKRSQAVSSTNAHALQRGLRHPNRTTGPLPFSTQT
jgi:protein phosphatase